MPHPRVEIVAGLLGAWQGAGHGLTPRPFDFDDRWEFTESGKPFLAFVERTRRDGAPAHTESGYLRIVEDGTVEIVAALPTGQTELGTGRVQLQGDDLLLSTDAAVENTPTAKAVSRVVRRFRLTGDVLVYEMDMAWSGGEYAAHLSSTLRRVSE